MNLYKAFHKSKSIEVSADTSYAAQTLAAKEMKARKQYDVTVVLLEIDSSPVIHSTQFA